MAARKTLKCATKTRSELLGDPSSSSSLSSRLYLSATTTGCKCYQMFYTCSTSLLLLNWIKPRWDIICVIVTSLICVSRLHSNCSRTYLRSLSYLFNRRSEELFPPAFLALGEGILDEDLLFITSLPSWTIGWRNLLPSILRRFASSTREPTMFPFLLVSMISRVPWDICGWKDS